MKAISRRLNNSELAGKITSVIIQINALQYLVAYIDLACLWRSILFMLDILTLFDNSMFCHLGVRGSKH